MELRRPITRLLRSDSLASIILGAGGLAIAGRVVHLGTIIVLTSALGSTGYGAYALTIAWATMLTLFGALGIPEFVTRELAIDRSTGQVGISKRLRRRLYVIQAIPLLFAMALVALANVTGLALYVNDLDADHLWWIVAFLPLYGAIGLTAAVLRGANLIKTAVVVRDFIPSVTYLASLAVVPVRDPETALLLFMASQGVGLLVAFYYLSRIPHSETPPGDHWPQGTLKFLRMTLPFMWLSSAYFINQRADIIMLGSLATLTDVGIYQLSAQFSVLVLFPLQLLNSLVGPQVAEAFKLEQRSKIENLFLVISAIAFTAGLVATIAIAVLFTIFGNELLSSEFHGALEVFGILAVGLLCNLAVGPVGMFLSMARHEKIVVNAMFYSAIANIIFNFIFIQMIGVYGAALATSISMVIWNIILVIECRKRIGIPFPHVLAIRKISALRNRGRADDNQY